MLLGPSKVRRVRGCDHGAGACRPCYATGERANHCQRSEPMAVHTTNKPKRNTRGFRDCGLRGFGHLIGINGQSSQARPWVDSLTPGMRTAFDSAKSHASGLGHVKFVSCGRCMQPWPAARLPKLTPAPVSSLAPTDGWPSRPRLLWIDSSFNRSTRNPPRCTRPTCCLPL
jgi:hypothetical protein